MTAWRRLARRAPAKPPRGGAAPARYWYDTPMVRPEQTASRLRVQVPSRQASERLVAGPSQRAETQRPSGASKASESEGAKNRAEHKVKATASSYNQPKGVRDGRAALLTAKATDRAGKSEEVLDIPGVLGGGTSGKCDAGQERPSPSAKSGEDPRYKDKIQNPRESGGSPRGSYYR